MSVRGIRYLIFLKDISVLAVTCFGGPQVHLTMFIKHLVQKHKYLTESELMELYSLCQVLPGPTSTQTITAIGFRLGGASLAYLTLLVWILPAITLMGLAAIGITYINKDTLINISQFIKPMGVAFVFFAAYTIGKKVINTKTSVAILVFATVFDYIFHSPYITPLLILFGGVASSFKFQQQEKTEEKKPIKIEWANFILWLGVLLFTAILGKITHSLPVRLFENFYRNGSLAFGGGHILKPLLYNEFVVYKPYLSSDEFLSGISLAELVPGPTFSIASFVGALSMRAGGVDSQILGAIIASIGIFLPGAFLIFFVIRFWEQLKQFRAVRASLEGVNAASTGLTFAAGVSLSQPMLTDISFVSTIIITLIALLSKKIPSYLIILIGLALGIILNF